MTKLITMLTVFGAFFLGTISAQSQITYEGSDTYGRMYNINFHPSVENHLYATTLGNHIMHSSDKGVTWDVLYSFPDNNVFLENLNFLSENVLSFSVKYSANLSKNAVYLYNITTGQITKTYTPPITFESDNVWISSFSIYATNPNIALVHQSYSIGFASFAKVYYTIDSGNTWQMVYYNETNNGIFPNNVAISPTDPNKLFIARGTGPNNIEGGLLISHDAGANWEEKIPGNTYSTITFHPEDTNNILLGTFIGSTSLGHQENLYRSMDGGETWNIIPITWADGTLNNVIGIYYNPLDLQNIILLEENEVVITHNDWATYEKTTYPLDNIEGYYYGIHASFNPFQNGEVFVNADYHPLFSQDGGETFNRLYNPFYQAGMAALQLGNENHLYHSVQRGLMHKNLSTGQVESYGILPVNYVFSSDAPIYMPDKLTTGRVFKYESGFSGSILQVSNDYGASYNDLYINFFDQLINLTTDPNNPNIIWAVFLYEGGVIVDFNDPENPAITYLSLPESDILTDVYIDEADSNIVYITVGAHVYRSEDGGGTWEDMSSGLNINPATDIIFDIERSPFNPNEFTIAASNGIYRTTDATNWTQVYQAQNVRKIEYSPLNGAHAVASIYSRNLVFNQIVYTKDGSETWEAVPFEAIAYVGSSSMAYDFHAESVDAYIATFDLGLLKYTVDLSTLGVPEYLNNTNTFIVYPNPTTGIINIKENGGKLVSASVFNALGQEVIKPMFSHKIDIAALNTGVYFLRIKNNDGSYFVKQIIKQ